MIKHMLLKNELGSPYMRRITIGRLRFHVFYRGDNDPDPHDHPWDFWTFPLTSYVEEVTRYPQGSECCEICDNREGCKYCDLASEPNKPIIKRHIVRAWRWHYRPATYVHRVIGKAADPIIQAAYQHLNKPGPATTAGKTYTIVWTSRKKRHWGFHINGAWVYWKDYIAMRRR